LRDERVVHEAGGEASGTPGVEGRGAAVAAALAAVAAGALE